MTVMAPTDPPDAQVRIADRYDSTARSYDEWRQGPFFDLASDVLKRMLSSIEAIKILDVPVGTGRAMPVLLRDGVQPEIYVGVDIAPNMLKEAGKKARALGIANYVGVQGSLWELPVPSNHFDVVLVLRMFHLFPGHTYRKALEEVHRVLRPGGVVIAEVRNRYRGVFSGYVRQWLDSRDKNELEHHYIRPRELRRAFGPLKILEARGYWFDTTWALSRVAQLLPSGSRMRRALLAVAFAFDKCLGALPTRYLSSELAIKAVKV